MKVQNIFDESYKARLLYLRWKDSQWNRNILIPVPSKKMRYNINVHSSVVQVRVSMGFKVRPTSVVDVKAKLADNFKESIKYEMRHDRLSSQQHCLSCCCCYWYVRSVKNSIRWSYPQPCILRHSCYLPEAPLFRPLHGPEVEEANVSTVRLLARHTKCFKVVRYTYTYQHTISIRRPGALLFYR